MLKTMTLKTKHSIIKGVLKMIRKIIDKFDIEGELIGVEVNSSGNINNT